MPRCSLPSPLKKIFATESEAPALPGGMPPTPPSTNCLLPDAGSDEAGQGLTEYLVLLLLIAVISISAARTLGNTIRGKLEMAERHIDRVQLENRD